jgi:hypothetical protein
MWARNAFDEWHEFWGFNIINCIVNLSKDEQFVMVFDDMMAMFILQVTERTMVCTF